MKINLIKKIVPVGAALLSTFYAQAQEAFETDRPTQTESTRTIPKNTFQSETGIGTEIKWENEGLFFDYSYLVPSTLFRIALGNRFELRVKNTLRSNRIRTDQTILSQSLSLDDPQVGFKWRVTNPDNQKFGLALMSHAVLPVGVSTVKKEVGLINRLLFSHQLTESLKIGYHIGHHFANNIVNDLTYSFFLSYGVFKRFDAFVECYGELVDMEGARTNIDAGFTYKLGRRIQVDYSFGFGIDHRMNFQQLGFSIRLPE